MQLVSFSYKSLLLNFSGIKLQTINLLVGRNGSGKSKTLQQIQEFVDLITGKPKNSTNAEWKIEFLTASKLKLDYSVVIGNNGDRILLEVLALEDKKLIHRTDETCMVWLDTTQQFEEFSPPKNALVLNVRRDTHAHPYFEEIINWASDLYSFRFATIVPNGSPNGRRLSRVNYSTLGIENTESEENLATIFSLLEPEQKKLVIDTMAEMGYNFSSVEMADHGELRFLQIQEKGIWYQIPDFFLSQGTYRTFVLLTYFQYLIHVKKPQLLTIDDLGEGLDYSRAFKLGKFVFDTCKNVGVQLIATSNDNFLMNAIPIEYWNLLQRTGSEITALNEKNNPQLFDDFAYSGLSNFDFLSSDYIESHQE